jgi:hypothetical protein
MENLDALPAFHRMVAEPVLGNSLSLAGRNW